MPKSAEMTVGKYLVHRMERAGLGYLFGVPGDYALDFFDLVESSSIKVVNTCSELNAGYAADAYARLRGLGAVCVTYGVGAFSLLNAVAGAFAERVPLVVISGGPGLSLRKEGKVRLLHHTLEDKQVELEIFRKMTAFAAILSDGASAPRQIDEALAICMQQHWPVYLEIPMDMVGVPCQQPGSYRLVPDATSDSAALAAAVAAASALLKPAQKPVVWAGEEVRRLAAREELVALLEHTGYPVSTSVQGKSVIPEALPAFVGTYRGLTGSESACLAVEGADVLLSLGVLMTDINLGGLRPRFPPERTIVALAEEVRIGASVYLRVGLKDFINALCAVLARGEFDPPRFPHPSQALREPFNLQPDARLTTARFWQRVNHFLESDYLVLADIGGPLLGAAELYLPGEARFMAQAYYLSLGYTVPAALGAGLAAPGRRPIALVGDGAFQMTGYEVSTLIRQGLNLVIFLINNDGYQIERVFHEGPFNDIQRWKYHLLPEVYGGGWGCEVRTEGELEGALARAKSDTASLALINVHLGKLDLPAPLDRMKKALGEVSRG